METDTRSKFYSGVIEGFYGEPWSFNERVKLYKRISHMKMNSYLYAPKDDSKHRHQWREAYTERELASIKTLIDSAKEDGVDFIFALSPGIDIVYSSEKELELLYSKLDQVKSIGCESFSLLFDDIENNLCPNDVDMFKNSATAQASVTNKVYEHLGRPELFLICPTEYCSTRAFPTVKDSPYLKTLGSILEPNILLFWTGPAVISKRISSKSIQELSDVVKRKIVIWDNLHANDYDSRRIFLGPFCGRPSGMKKDDCLAGVMTNPNCEFEANYIALHTLGQWTQSSRSIRIEVEDANHDSSSEEETCEDKPDKKSRERVYSPRDALEKAIQDWHYVVNEKEEMLFSNIGKISPMETDTANEEGDDAKSKNMDLGEYLSLEQLRMLADYYYLPFSEGQRAKEFIDLAYWLKFHTFKVLHDQAKNRKTPALSENKEWAEKFAQFIASVDKIVQLKRDILRLPNRFIIVELLPYLFYLENGALTALYYIKWLSSVQDSSQIIEAINSQPISPQIGPNQVILSRSHSPWTYRSSITADLYRLLPFGNYYDIYNIIDSIYQHSGPAIFSSLTSSSTGSENPSDNQNLLNATKNLPIITANYKIRPAEKSDIDQIYEMNLLKILQLNSIDPKDPFLVENREQIRKLLGDRQFLAFIQCSPETCFVIEYEKDSNFCLVAATLTTVKPSMQELFWKGYRLQNMAEKEFSPLLEAWKKDFDRVSGALGSLLAEHIEWINLSLEMNSDNNEIIHEKHAFTRIHLVTSAEFHDIYLMRLFVMTLSALKTCHHDRAYSEVDYRDTEILKKLENIGFRSDTKSSNSTVTMFRNF